MGKVLIIDDEKNILNTLSSILEDEGFAVSKARDGTEGLAIFAREEPDIVLASMYGCLNSTVLQVLKTAASLPFSLKIWNQLLASIGILAGISNVAGLLIQSLFLSRLVLNWLALARWTCLFPVVTLGAVSAINFFPGLASATFARLDYNAIKQTFFRNPLEKNTMQYCITACSQ